MSSSPSPSPSPTKATTTTTAKSPPESLPESDEARLQEEKVVLDNHLALLQETKDTLNEMLQKRAGREKNTDPTTPSPHDETVDDETECALATVREFEEEWAMPAPLSIVKGGEARGQQVDKGSGQVEESKGGSGKETVEES